MPVSIIATMTVRRAPPAPERRVRGQAAAPADAEAAPAVLNELARYIPTEAIAVYVAILPFTVPKDLPLTYQHFTSRWVLALAVGLAAILFSVGVYRRALLDRGEPFRWPARRTATVVLAYAAWVFAIPASPLNEFGWYTGALGAVVGTATTTVITLVHLWFGPPED